jgi:hypothetical protein
MDHGRKGEANIVGFLLTKADMAGFVVTQAELREIAGTPVVFRVPTDPVWPEGTKINPQTGRPYDPTIKPQSGGSYTNVSVTALIILKQGSPLRPQSDTEFKAVGLMSGMDLILDVSPADRERVDLATRIVVNALEYELMEWKPFSLGGEIYRWLCYGQQE